MTGPWLFHGFVFAMHIHANPLVGPLKTLGIELSPRAMTIAQVAAVVLPLAMVGGGAAYLWWRSKKGGPRSAVGAASSALDGAQISPKQLRRAWKAFVQGLPPSYERSILNFEHFLVLGAEASGKSRLVDVYSDWRRQAKQLPGAESASADLPVYLGSGLVVTELPTRFLTDHSARCRAALTNLWKPLYRRRAPTVVVTLDVRTLREGQPEVLQELAESIRAKVNLLSNIRGRPIEVRTALTFLDTFEGYADFARFCRDENIPTQLSAVTGTSSAELEQQLSDWIEGLRDLLSRALTEVRSEQFLRIIAFLRQVPDIVPALAKFLSVLFGHEALSLDPMGGGVYFVAEPASASSPLERAAERGPGPDPRRKHLFATAIVASGFVAYLLAAYVEQRALYHRATAALDAYGRSHELTSSEAELRASVIAFTGSSHSFLESHPDYFSTPRTRLRRAFSESIRDRVLVPQLQKVASEGLAGTDTRDLPTRRAAYFLTLIHSDKFDRLGLKATSNNRLWARMTGLPPELIRDYIDTTDQALSAPVEVEIRHRDVEPKVNWQVWVDFLRDVDAAVRAGAKRPDELSELALRAKQLEAMLPQYAEDEQTVPLLDRLDIAAGTVPTDKDALRPLKQAYKHKLSDFFDYEPQYKVHEQSEPLTNVLHLVQRAAIVTQTSSPLLRDLIARLNAAADNRGAGRAADESRVKMAGQDFVFNAASWDTMLRGSTGREIVDQFLRAAVSSGSIFFDSSDDLALPPLRWNPANNGGSIFTGRAEIQGRYTKEGYESRVASQVWQLNAALDRAQVPEDQRRQVRLAVLDAVRRYATEYRSQNAAFIRSFGVRAQSPEALRVALAEMIKSEGSAYQELLVTISQNTRITSGAPVTSTNGAAGDEDKGGEPTRINDAGKDLLQPMLDAMNEFRVWREVVGESGKGADLGKYRSILSQLLTDLGPGAADGGEESSATPDTLEKALAPVGRLVLSEVKGEKGSYGQLVNEWMLSVGLPDYQRPTFSLPLAELQRLGRRDIEQVIVATWEHDVLPDLRQLSTQFPFDPSANDDASAADVTAMFHPQTGRIFEVFRRFYEPISDFGDGGPFRPKASAKSRLTIPAELYEVTNRAAMLSARLWDGAGAPLPLAIRVATVPFEHGRNPQLAQTLVYMNAGNGSLFNFNQKPAEVTMQLDWTREYNAQVGLQLTDMDSKQNVFPEPVRAEGSIWALLRLLRKGESTPAKSPVGARLYTWQIVVPPGAETMPVQYVVVDDVWSLFALGPYVRNKLTAKAQAASTRAVQ